jgi:hypothetical protein
MGSHVTVSVGTALEPQLLVRGTELVQVSSPVQSAHYSPDLLNRTGARSRYLAASYAGCFALGQLAVLKLLAKVPPRSLERNRRNASCARLWGDFLRNPQTGAMQEKPSEISALVLDRGWSNRILLLATAVSCFLAGNNQQLWWCEPKMAENTVNRSSCTALQEAAR